MSYPGKNLPNPKASYCSIPWGTIKLWRSNLSSLLRSDMICLTIVNLAYTSIRRIGSFVPKSKAAATSFAWIVPRYVRFLEEDYTFLVWIPFNKSDPHGKVTTLVVKRKKQRVLPSHTFTG